ncbi:hypothetical protein GOP47_0005751 [Adiantum capillus-veneris]|uniref:Pentatricopeptide repeat-containing protein n=1 Tax=Adiantum capillus-veneris TaxID=13818 RepID=A0A9D4ZNJ6_ADICA|nr:hypothetical protein GOP47_0005751 [Adiantum capillus-veneris]
MFHVGKRLLRLGAASVERGSSVKLPCSFGVLFIAALPPVSFVGRLIASGSSSQKAAGFSEGKNGLASHALYEKLWCLLKENEPLSSSAVFSMLKQPMPLEHALLFLSWACKQPGFAPGTDDVNQIAHLWASKFTSFALKDLEECFDSAGSMYTDVTWATLITTSNILNKPQQSISVFMHSQKHGCVPSQLLYDPLLFALVKCQRFDTAILIIREMLAANILPGKLVLGIFLDALCKVGKSKDAYKLVQEMGQMSSSASFRDGAYSRLICAVWRTAHSSMALDLLNEMKAKGFEPDKHAYNACIKLLCKKQGFELAQRLLKHMNEHGCSADAPTYTILVDGLYKAGRAKDALEVIELLTEDERPLDHSMYKAFLSCLVAVGRIDEAFDVFGQMQRDGGSEDPVLYYVMIKSLCDIGEIKRALDLKKTMNEKGFKADAHLYQLLQQGLCKGSRYVDELLLLIEELKSNGYAPIAKSYWTLVTHFYCLEDFENSRSWAEEMVKEGHKPTPFIKTRFPELRNV